MRKLLLFIVLFISILCVSAQDEIVTKDGKMIYAKIIKVDSEVIKYKLYSDQAGESFYIEKINVKYIKYEDGKYQTDFDNSVDINEDKLHRYEDYINKENKEIIKKNKYLLAYNRNKNGKIMLGLGVPLGVTGIVLIACASTYSLWYFPNHDYDNPEGQLTAAVVGLATFIPGAVLIPFGIVNIVMGSINMNRYGTNLYENSKISVDMAVYGNGIGLKLKF